MKTRLTSRTTIGVVMLMSAEVASNYKSEHAIIKIKEIEISL